MFRKIRFYLAVVLVFFKRDKKKISYGAIVLLLVVFVLRILIPTFGPQGVEAYSEITRPVFIEGVVGKPSLPNPLFDTTETQKDISGLVFRGLTKIDSRGKVVPDLAESFKKTTETEYVFVLKKNIFWHDGEEFNADDVIYTITSAQDPQYGSPFAANFKDVKVEKVDDFTVKFKLAEPFAPFPLVTDLGIIPEHISLKSFRPIGTGPFEVKKINGEKIILSNEKLNLVFQFFTDLNEAKLALKLGRIHGLGGLSPQDAKEFEKFGNKNVFTSPLPFRQVTIFFNTKAPFLGSSDIRQALSYATNKKSIIAAGGSSSKVSTTQLSLTNPLAKQKERYDLNLKKSEESLKKAGFKFSDGIWMKDKKKLEIQITSVDDPELNSIVNLLKESWSKVGISVEINLVSVDDIHDKIIPDRNFQALVNFQEVSPDSDQYVLWHTTQVGKSNITGISSAKLDKILEDARKISDNKQRNEKYKLFTELLLDEAPAIFLYYPQYTWVVSNKVTGIGLQELTTPGDRFDTFEDWSIKRKFF